MSISEARFSGPEQAALAGFPEAQVLSMEVAGERAEVRLLIEGEQYWVYCLREQGGWRETVSGNGPTAGWRDPDRIQWG